MSIWDDPQLQASGDFVRFDKPGDTVSGQVVAIRMQKFDDGRTAPQIQLVTDDGEEKALTAGQYRLKQALVEQRPEPGDHIKVTLTEIQPLGGGKTLKVFDVEVKRGAGTPTPAPAPAPAAAPAAAAPWQQPPWPSTLPQPPAPAPAPAPAAPTAAAAGTPDPAAIAAALAQLTPEQKALLGISA